MSHAIDYTTKNAAAAAAAAAQAPYLCTDVARRSGKDQITIAVPALAHQQCASIASIVVFVAPNVRVPP
ncbi:hypothetical protein [Polymorphobacter sp. PAMC 29334]|uniref:hypothetical protein n=1 Tax=Polymorphobacter sp. PAMC 29334 TaxID=2862331 RepID=UPI001CA5C86D|nr:hypothetical protein [Polymorphobacter sp. PAMC 29334]